MTYSNSIRAACLLSLGLAAHAVYAQAPAAPAGATANATAVGTATAQASGFEAAGVPSSGDFAPGSIRLGNGNVMFTPTLAVGFGVNDNLTLTSNKNRPNSSFYTIAPTLVLSSQYGPNQLSLGYQAEATQYSSYSAFNTENQELAASGSHDLDTRFALDWRAAYQNRYDPVGSTDTAGSAKPDRWEANNLIVAGRYGAEQATGNIEGEIGAYDKQYLNNRTTTAGSDYKSINVVGRFLYRVAPATRVLTEYRHTQFDYRLKSTNLDNVEQRLLVGARWTATAATSGEFKIGYLNKDYARERKSFKGTTWEGGFRWAPLTYSTLDVSLGRGANDSTGFAADYITNNFLSLGWTHNWRSYFNTRLGYNISKSDYVGGNRKDRLNEWVLGASYVVSRWAQVSAEAKIADRNSDIDFYDYRRNILSVKLDLAF